MTLEETFEEITNDRIEGQTKHKLVDILMIVFFGILCGYKTIEEIHFYAETSRFFGCHKIQEHYNFSKAAHLR